jgi:hypothetical protein
MATYSNEVDRLEAARRETQRAASYNARFCRTMRDRQIHRLAKKWAARAGYHRATITDINRLTQRRTIAAADRGRELTWYVRVVDAAADSITLTLATV